MLIAEYDYDMDIEVQREESFNEGKALGMAKGKSINLISIVRKKAAKDVSAEDCATFLEEDLASIQQIYRLLATHPDWTDEKIYSELSKSV